MNAGDSFFALKNYAKGKISKYELLDSDPLIHDVIQDSSNPAQSIVKLRFDNDTKFLESLGLAEDDVWAAARFGSYYDPYEYYDSYQIKQDFLEGYGMWHDFNDSTIELIKRISKLLGQGNFDEAVQSDKESFAEKIYNLFPKLIDGLCVDYAYEKNIELNTTASESIRKDISSFVENYGFELLSLDGVKTTVADLISAYLQYNVPHLPLKKLLKEIFEDGKSSLGGWSENIYEYQNDKNFDKEAFNRDAERVFEKILDELEGGEGAQPFLQMIDRVSNKFRTNVWYDLPKNKTYKIKVKGFERDGRKIQVELRGPDYMRTFSISEEGFYKLLYNLELFDFVDK